jgi:putative tricarboxylic transport membrane protein
VKKHQRVGGYVILACALYLMVQSFRLSLGPPGQPGPGFLGFFLGVALAISAGALIFFHWGEDRGSSSKTFWRAGAWRRPLFSLGALMAFVASMWALGVLATMILFFLFWLRRLERTSWLLASLVSLIGTSCFYLVFVILLQIPLPRGLFWE